MKQLESHKKNIRNYGRIKENQYLVQVYHSDEDCYYVSMVIINDKEITHKKRIKLED